MKERKVTSFDQMKQKNLKTVYRTIVEHKPISRIEIAQRTGLNKMTVTNCVKGLMDQGIVAERELPLDRENAGSSVGRPPIGLTLNKDYGAVLGIEINVISCKILLIDFCGNVLDQILMREGDRDPQRFIQHIQEHTAWLQNEVTRFQKGLLGIGLALPGNYNGDTGYVEYVSNMQAWNGYPIRDAMAEAFPNVPVLIQDAGRAGARGEIDFGGSFAEDNMMYIQGAMGLTLSMYSNRGTYVGFRGFNGRFGHNIIQVGGRRCICGNQGCLEMYASIHALCERLYPGQPVTDEMIADLIRRKSQHDSEVEQSIAECIRYLAVGLANMLNCFNSRHIYIGNYLGMVLEGEEEKLNREVEQYLLRHYKGHQRVFTSKLKEWGAAYGAAALVCDSVIGQ